jgi:hypothetical protein
LLAASFFRYYDSLCSLLEVLSPGYKARFTEKLSQRLRLLESGEDNGELLAPATSYVSSPTLDAHLSGRITSSSSDSFTAE